MGWRRFFGLGDKATSPPEKQPEQEHRPDSGQLERQPYPQPELEALLAKCLGMFKRPSGGSGQLGPARDYLPNLAPQALLEADERLRSYSSYAFQQWPDKTLSQVTARELAPSLQQSLLFVSAGHYSGWIRERTLCSIPEFPGYLTLAISLIRCSDWVPQVRHAAQHAVTQLLDRCASEDIVAVWPLVLRLQTRERTSKQWLEVQVEKWMLRSESLSCLRPLLRSDNAAVRAWAFTRSLDAGISVGFDLLEAAIADPSPAIALHALRYAQQQGDPARIRSLADTGLRAPHPVIRRESLRALAGVEGTLTREFLLDTACDRASGVRALSTFLLRERYGEDAVAHWRSVLDKDDERPSIGALVSLADQAQTQDAARMRRWLADENGLIRMHCLRGLLKAVEPLTDEEFVRLATQGGSRVMRFLAQAIRAGDIPVDVDRTAFVVTCSMSTPSTRQNLRTLLEGLGHWDRLALLLRLHLGDGVANDWWYQALEDWTRVSRRYVPLGPSRRTELLELLEVRRNEMYDVTYAMARDSIARH